MTTAHQTLLFASGADVNVDFDLSFIAQIALFGLFIVLLKPILFEPLLALFEEREKRTEGARAQARKMDETAGDLVKKFETEIEKVRHAANLERDRLRAETSRLEAQILADAKTQSTAIIEAGRVRITKEMATLRSELEASRPALAEQIASKIIGREVRS
jgi:F-type H+-transporting ATPase subunit b